MLTKTRQSADLSFAEFQSLLREHGLGIAEGSPLFALSGVEPEGDLVKFEKLGMLEKKGDWHDALIAVCEPDFMTSSVLAFTGTAASSSHFTNRANSKMIVGCWPQDDKHLRISFPWEPGDIIANSLSALVVDDRATFSDIREMRFSADGFAALAAATDAVRAVLLASTLQRQQISSFELPRTKLDEMLQMSADDKSVDARWLVTLFRALTPDSCFSSNKTVSGKGFQELVDHQLIKLEDDDHWRPTRELMSIASDWLVPLPAIYHEAITINPGGSQDVVSNMALRGSGPLCLVKFENIADDKPGVFLRSMKADEFWLHLMGQLTPPKAESKPEPKPKPQKKQEPVLKPVVKMEPSWDGEPVACRSCGASIEPDAKFCTHCGAKAEPPVARSTCPGCGAAITSDLKFCLQCGKKL